MLPGILSADSAQSNAGGCDALPLGVEIRHNDFETSVFFVEKIRDGYFHVIESDKCASRSANSGIKHLTRRDTADFQGNDEQGDATCSFTTGTDSSSDIVGVDTVGDPFLGTIDYIVVAFADGCGLDARYVRAGYVRC